MGISSVGTNGGGSGGVLGPFIVVASFIVSYMPGKFTGTSMAVIGVYVTLSQSTTRLTKKSRTCVHTHIISKRIELESPCWSGFEAFRIFFKTCATGAF